MSIYLTDDIEVKTKKGKMGGAKQIFLEGDTQTVEKEIKDINSRHDTLKTKHESLSKTVQDISATGKANTATEVTYNNTNSGIVAENIQDAVDKLAAKDATKAEKSDVQSSVSELKAKNTLQDEEIAKKFNKEDVSQELSEDETKVASMKCVKAAFDETNSKVSAVSSLVKMDFIIDKLSIQASTTIKNAVSNQKLEKGHSYKVIVEYKGNPKSISIYYGKKISSEATSINVAGSLPQSNESFSFTPNIDDAVVFFNCIASDNDGTEVSLKVIDEVISNVVNRNTENIKNVTDLVLNNTIKSNIEQATFPYINSTQCTQVTLFNDRRVNTENGKIYKELNFAVLVAAIPKGAQKVRITGAEPKSQVYTYSTNPIFGDAENISKINIKEGTFSSNLGSASFIAITFSKQTNPLIYIEWDNYAMAEDVREINKAIDYKSQIEKHTSSGAGKIKFVFFESKLIANRKYFISVKASGTYASITCYWLKSKGTLDDGYSQIQTQEGNTVEYVPTSDGYFMFNFNAETTTDVSVEIKAETPINEGVEQNTQKIEQNTQKIAELSKDNTTIYKKAKLLINSPKGCFSKVHANLSDVYVTLAGDSITAFQSTHIMPSEGVTHVPPTCDRVAVAYNIWNHLNWGNANYRRFDEGKQSLVGKWSKEWTDDTNAFFKENGLFTTEYLGKTMREKFPVTDSLLQVTTKIDQKSFPTQFDISENSWWQRNIPKRFSHEANASVSFTIPAGYSKFDFIYHAHIYGDSVTISTNRNNGIVKLNTSKPNNWEEAIEANGAIADLSMETKKETDGGNDSYGIPNMRLYFQISDTSEDTVVTITKTSDENRYLIYWGISYWGTTSLPYAIHINNMAIGGYTQTLIYDLRSSMFKYVYSDAIIMELCANNIQSPDFVQSMNKMKTALTGLKSYFSDKMNIDISKDIAVWVAHVSGDSYKNREAPTICNQSMSERIANELGYSVFANMTKVMEAYRNNYEPDLSMEDFMVKYGDLHLSYEGYQIFRAAFDLL